MYSQFPERRIAENMQALCKRLTEPHPAIAYRRPSLVNTCSGQNASSGPNALDRCDHVPAKFVDLGHPSF
jgi:hypothetical protein